MHTKQRSIPRRLAAERLEDRCLLAVVFGTGSGSAVTTVDRSAEFTAAGAIDVLDYSEDGLRITSPSGAIAAQPGPFNPFTAFAPGIAGYFAVANDSYVSIRNAEAAPMAGIELRIGDLFGAGPGQPPDPRSTYLVWETQRDGLRTAGNRVLVTVNTVVSWADVDGIDELRIAASGFPSYLGFGGNQAIAIDDLRVQIDTSGGVTFTTGAGSAVSVADRSASFAAAGTIEPASYSEDMLSITSSEGTTAPQPAAFNPFTSAAPGISGYFAVRNSTYISIRLTDEATLVGIEFKLGDLFGAGPGQPPDPQQTYLVWEAYRGGAQTGTDRARLAVGTVVAWSDPGGIDELRVAASGFPEFASFGMPQAIALDDLRVEIDSSGGADFATGAGAAVFSVHRLATFDAGSAIDAGNYQEDSLRVSSSPGSITAQPGAFNPFTGVAPGVAGYFGLANSSFVSIRAADAAPMAGVEFRVGDLFGVGPGQPPDPFRTFLVWETYRGGERTGADRALVADGTIVGWRDLAGIDELRVGASGFVSYTEFGQPQAIALDDLKVQLVGGEEVAFTTGVGSAVGSRDRVSHFTAGGNIDVSGYEEDGLRLATQGSSAAQPGPFDPFTGSPPGTAGYFAAANTTYVSIRAADSAPMAALEFTLGDLFGDGPGRPPNPFSTYLVWETYRDGVRTATDRLLLPDGSVVGWSADLGFDELRVGASGFSTFTAFGQPQGIAIDDLAVELATEEAPFSVTAFASTTSGFRAEFSGAFEGSVINLFDTQAAGLGPSDAGLRDAAGELVAGSLLLDPDRRGVRFVKSGGPLAAGSYVAVLRSAVDGFRAVDGRLLDGDRDGTAGGDFSEAFTISAAPAGAITVGLPDIVRGPGQQVNIPASTAAGIPFSLSDTAGVRAVRLEVHYDPSLLTIEGVSLPNGVPDGSQIELDQSTAGVAALSFSSPSELSAEQSVLFNLQASVPSSAEHYGRSQLLQLREVTVSNSLGAALATHADDALHLATYFGDVSGNGRINASDASQAARFAALIDHGFTGSLLVDPVLLGDISGNGRINAIDASLIARFVALIDVPEIPPLPAADSAAPSGRRGLDSVHFVAGAARHNPRSAGSAATEIDLTSRAASLVEGRAIQRSAPLRARDVDLLIAADEEELAELLTLSDASLHSPSGRVGP